MRYMRTYSMAMAKNNFPRLAAEVRKGDALLLTHDGRPAVVLIGYQDFLKLDFARARELSRSPEARNDR